MTKFLISYVWIEVPRYDKMVVKSKESIVEYYYSGKIVNHESIVVGQRTFYPENLSVVVIDAKDKKDALEILHNKFQYHIKMVNVEELDKLYEYGKQILEDS